MNKTDIIETALHVWGRELYKTTSLSHIAQALGVTKPALYRHFSGKKALLEGIYGYCCDHYVGFVAKTFDKTVEDRGGSQGILLIARTVAEYCVRHKYIFIFFLLKVYGDRAWDGDMPNQFALRGMDLTKHWFFLRSKQGYPNPFQLIIPTVYFLATLFHKGKAGADPTEEEIQRFLSLMEDILSRGLGFDSALVEALDFGQLEATGSCRLPPEEENEGLLKAVAGVVAQTGPWNASMGMVAKRSGLSKSGLYAH
ncbi:MAG: TetR/AcrR family transcriptional regulator, partial [Treponema sp.]|nr:TetR/AcrR family transcriptional regulator [Treponema sp.]